MLRRLGGGLTAVLKARPNNLSCCVTSRRSMSMKLKSQTQATITTTCALKSACLGVDASSISSTSTLIIVLCSRLFCSSTVFKEKSEMMRLRRDGTTKPVSRDQILRRERGQGNTHFSCSADHVQDWQPYPVDPYSCYVSHSETFFLFS